MPYIIAAVSLLATLCVLNLLLTIGVIRRLREITTAAPPPDLTLGVGATIGDFRTTTTNGERITEESWGTRFVVAFLSPDCTPCRERLPDFLAHASTSPLPSLAVVLGEAREAAEMVAALERVCPVVVERYDGPISSAFRVRGTPAFVVVEGKKVVALGLPGATVPA